MFKCMPFLACNRQVDSLDKRQCNLEHIPDDVARYARSLEELLLDSNHIKELSKVPLDLPVILTRSSRAPRVENCKGREGGCIRLLLVLSV